MYQDYHVERTSLLNFLEISSILDNFPSETANIIAHQTILSLKGYGCSCSNNMIISSKVLNTSGIFYNREIGKEIDKEKEKKDHIFSTQPYFSVAKTQTVSLKTSLEVNWILEIMKYSITIPVFTHPEVVRHAVHIYSSWLLKSLCESDSFPKGDMENETTGQIPTCIKDNANDYAPMFISSLCNFFKNFIHSYSQFVSLVGLIPPSAPNAAEQKADSLTLLKEVSILIEKILYTVEHISINSKIINNATWDSLLYFCLNVGSLMLSCPSEPTHLTYTLADRISAMVFKIWLQACSKYFPRPSLWKTFNKLCQSWRHQEAFINQWNKINAAFTNRLLAIIHRNSSFPNIPEVDQATKEMIPTDLTDNCIKDCWYRFINIIGNPVDICQSKLVLNFDFLDSKSKRRSSSQAALSHAISNLPNIFHRAMHGISNIVDAFLGFEQPSSGFVINENLPVNASQPPVSTAQKLPLVNIEQASPPEIRKQVGSHPIFNIRKGKTVISNSRTPISHGFDSITGSVISSDMELSVESVPDPHSLRPEVNSMLKLFGNWLFEASIVGVKQCLDNAAISVRASNVEASKYNAGRAEACGTLCRLFTHCHRHNISMDYLTKFYIIIYYGLDIEPSTASSLVLSTILFNTIDILRIGLVGVNVLVPRLFRGVEFVLTNDIEKPDLLSKNQLRRAAIHHIFSMICLPSYFVNIDIKPLLPILNPEKRDSFQDIRKNMSLLLSENIKNENDAMNLHLLVGCLIAFLESMVKDEVFEQNISKSTDTLSNEKCDIKVNNVVINVPSALSNYGSDIFNHALGLLSINLVHKWKDEMNILQFVLETLSDMAKMKFKNIDQKICKRSIRFLCEFIENQMNRKQKEHVRLLHNVIISAYYCLALWLVHHPTLLDDRDCLTSVLEISELGISGSKSKTFSTNGSENVRFKNSKSSSPTSKRVQVAAEYLLHCIMSELGAYPGFVGVETTSSLVNEELLLREMSTSPGDENQFSFRYFGLDNDIILALLEKPLNKFANPNDPLPTLSVIVRTCFGRYVWEMRLRQLPANYDSCDTVNTVPIQDCFNGVSVLMDKLFRSRPYNTGIFKQMSDFQDMDINEEDSEPNYFPDIINRVEPFKVEFSIPKLESLLDDSEKQRIEAAIVENLKTNCTVRSSAIKTRQYRSKHCLGDLQCKKPTPVTEIQTARLLLYHMGYLTVNAFLYDNSSDISNFSADQESRITYNWGADNLDASTSNLANKNNNNVLSPSTSLLPTFFPLDSSTSNFFTAIDGLDRTPSRTTDTCMIYYVKSGQTCPLEIIANYNDWPNFNTDFLAILLSLGWLVDVAEHPGWTGNIETSFQVNHISTNTPSSMSRGSFKYRNKFSSASLSNSYGINNNMPKEFHRLIQGPVPDGSVSIIYWADSFKEVVFLMASNENFSSSTNKMELGFSLADNAVTPTGPVPLSKDFGNPQLRLYADKSKDSGMAVALVWVEKWDDIESINIVALVGKDRLAILVCPTPEGLFRIKIYRPIGKYFSAGPLFSGMILDIKNLGSLIRQTVININRRIRQDSENFYASHFMRSQKLQHIITEHRLQQSTSQLPDLFTSLLYSPICRTEPRF